MIKLAGRDRYRLTQTELAFLRRQAAKNGRCIPVSPTTEASVIGAILAALDEALLAKLEPHAREPKCSADKVVESDANESESVDV